MKNLKYIIVSVILLAAFGFFIQCGSEKSDPGNKEEQVEQKGDAVAGYRTLKIDPKFIKQWNIKLSAPETREYIEKISLTGVVKENKNTTYLINTPVCGVGVEVKKDIGDAVRKGDTLCVLNSPELLDLKTRYIKIFQDFRLKKENFERAKNLVKIKGLEQKEFIGRESDYKNAMAEYFSLEAQLNTIGYDTKTLQALKEAVQQDETEKVRAFLSPFYRILAPANGKVMTRELNLGERVENNKTIYEVSDTRKLWVLLDAREKDLQYIDKNKPLTIVSDVYPGEKFSGLTLSLDEKIDPELRTIKIRAEVDNSDSRLKPEMYVKGLIEKKVKTLLPAVPSSALIKLAGVDGVFVKIGDDFIFKPLEVMETDSDGYAFVKGIGAGDQIVVVGAFYLKSEYALQGEEGE